MPYGGGYTGGDWGGAAGAGGGLTREVAAKYGMAMPAAKAAAPTAGDIYARYGMAMPPPEEYWAFDPATQYGESYGFEDVPRTLKGKEWLEGYRATRGVTPTAYALRHYEAQFAAPGKVPAAREAWGAGEYVPGMEKAVQPIERFDVPTGFPASLDEFTAQHPEFPVGSPELATEFQTLKKRYLDAAHTYLTELGGENIVGKETLLQQIKSMLDANYFGSDLPLFDTLRRWSANIWEVKGYTSTEKGREKFPYMYEGLYPPDYYTRPAGGFFAGVRAPGARPTARAGAGAPTRTRGLYQPMPQQPWDWRALTPSARWLTY